MTFPLFVLVSVLGFFWVLLPGVVLAMTVVAVRSKPEIETTGVRLCPASDATDPAAKSCWVAAGEDYCPRHLHLAA